MSRTHVSREEQWEMEAAREKEEWRGQVCDRQAKLTLQAKLRLFL